MASFAWVALPERGRDALVALELYEFKEVPNDLIIFRAPSAQKLY